MKWIIVNSCGTRCFTRKTFKTYENGWDFLYSEFPLEDNEDILDDYFVIKTDTPYQEYVNGMYISFN